MRCKNCGTENPDGSRFCATCGKPLEQEEPAKNVAEQKEELSRMQKSRKKRLSRMQKSRKKRSPRIQKRR